jgi:diguanylate cyclase (GGDEF)-like protein
LRFSHADSEFGVTVSIGMAQVTAHDDELAQVLERADKALYVAKKKGRDRVETLEPAAVAHQALIPVAG